MKNQMKNQIGKQVIVRAKTAGVFFGTLVGKKNDEVQLENARKIYYWKGANTVEELALKGVKNIPESKFTVVVKELTIMNVIQIIPCTEEAIQNINSVPEWKQ